MKYTANVDNEIQEITVTCISCKKQFYKKTNEFISFPALKIIAQDIILKHECDFPIDWLEQIRKFVPANAKSIKPR